MTDFITSYSYNNIYDNIALFSSKSDYFSIDRSHSNLELGVLGLRVGLEPWIRVTPDRDPALSGKLIGETYRARCEVDCKWKRRQEYSAGQKTWSKVA